MTSGRDGTTQANRDLIAAARDRGTTVTPEQLGRWRDNRLIEAPIQASPGRGRGRPSERYPDGTLERVMIIARLLESKPRVTFDDLQIWLFLFGHDTFLSQARSATERQASGLQKRLRDMPSGTRTLGFTGKMLNRISRTALHAMITTAHGTKKLVPDSPAYDTALAAIDMLAGREPTDPQAFDRLAEAFGIEDSSSQRTFRDLMIGARPSQLSSQLKSLDDAGLIAARNAGIKLVELMMCVIPGHSGESWQERSWGLRSNLRVHAITAIFGVIQIARSQRVLGNLYSSLDEVIHAVRNGEGEYAEFRPVEP